MVKPELNRGVDPALLAEAGRRGDPAAGLSERDPRLHLQKVDPQGARDRPRRWAEANAEAIEEHNAFMAERGLLSDHLRNWRGIRPDHLGHGGDKVSETNAKGR